MDVHPAVGEALPHTLRFCPSCLSTPASVHRPLSQTWRSPAWLQDKETPAADGVSPLCPSLERGEMEGREHMTVFLVG